MINRGLYVVEPQSVEFILKCEVSRRQEEMCRMQLFSTIDVKCVHMQSVVCEECAAYIFVFAYLYNICKILIFVLLCILYLYLYLYMCAVAVSGEWRADISVT